MAESYYYRKPKTSPAGVFCILFGVITIWTLVQVVLVVRKKKDRRLWIILPFVAGGMCECLGYIARICSIRSPTLTGPWIAQKLLILLAPALFTITYHLTINRVFSVLDARKFSIIPLQWLAKVFITLDMLSFFLLGAGVGLLSRDSSSQQENGRRIIVGGSALQIALFVLFLTVLIIFQLRLKKNPTPQSIEYRQQPSNLRNWKMIIVSLYISSVFMILRSLLVCFQHGQGANGHISKYEGYMYVFDSTLMFLSMLFFMLQNIGQFFYHMRYQVRPTPDVALEQMDNYSDAKLT